MIPSPLCNPPTIFKVLILLQLFFNAPSSLQINHTSHHKRSITRYIDRNFNSAASPMPVNPQKKLQRLPHVFSRTLELPLRSHADVFIEDRSDCFRFKVNIEDNAFSGEVSAYAVKTHPGVTKVVVRGGNYGGEVELLLEKLDIDVWRFRLPATTRPEFATAVVIGREVVVTGVAKVGGLKIGVAGGGDLCLYSKYSD